MALNVVERYLISVRGDRLSSHRRNHRYPTERGSTDRFPPRLRSTKRLKSRSAASVRVPRLATPPAWAQAPGFLDDLGHCTGSAAALIPHHQYASHDWLTLAVSGAPITNERAPLIGPELVGPLAAAVILRLMFGTIIAAGPPILVALAGLAVSSMLTGLDELAGRHDRHGVGIDGALLMVTRFREWRAAGLDNVGRHGRET